MVLVAAGSHTTPGRQIGIQYITERMFLTVWREGLENGSEGTVNVCARDRDNCTETTQSFLSKPYGLAVMLAYNMRPNKKS